MGDQQQPGRSVFVVARRHGVGVNRLLTRRRLMTRGAFTAASVGEEVVPACGLRAAWQQLREPRRPLSKRTLKTGILRAAIGSRHGRQEAALARVRLAVATRNTRPRRSARAGLLT